MQKLLPCDEEPEQYIFVKALPRVQYGKNGMRACSQETNIAQGNAECYIRLKTKPGCYFSILHLRQCFNWFIVLVGLFEEIAMVLLGAIERQLTQKVPSLALADHLKAIYLC